MDRDNESSEDHGAEDGFRSGLKALNRRSSRLTEKMAAHGPLRVHMV